MARYLRGPCPVHHAPRGTCCAAEIGPIGTSPEPDEAAVKALAETMRLTPWLSAEHLARALLAHGYVAPDDHARQLRDARQEGAEAALAPVRALYLQLLDRPAWVPDVPRALGEALERSGQAADDA